MTVGVLLLAISAAQGLTPRLSLDERCSLVATILHASAKKGLQGGERPRVIDLSFLQIDTVRDSVTRQGRAVVRPQWQMRHGNIAIFAEGESCGDDEFVLEQAAPGENGVKADPRGNSDHVVVVRVKKSSSKKSPRFSFEESLGLSIHAHSPEQMRGGGYAVPATKYSGTAETVGGKWVVKVTKAIFAS